MPIQFQMDDSKPAREEAAMTEMDNLTEIDEHEYANDAEGEREAEIVGFEPDDLRNVPRDEGDSGNADPPEGGV
jgi:hypothetical protein